MKNIRLIFLLLSITLLYSCQKINIEITNLRCELLTDPLGIDCPNPRLSWELTTNERNTKQKNYHILVASSLNKLNANEGDLWDSKQTTSDASVFIPYQGKKLENRIECYWKVCVETNNGKSDWSKPAKWTIGLIDSSEWQAKWIGLNQSFEWDAPDAECTRLSARYFRKEFETTQTPQKATLYISGLGLYKLSINGKTIGNQELSPTPTDYRKEAKYNTFDVSEDLQKGVNTVGIILGNGRLFHMRKTKDAEYPKVIFQLELEYADGQKQVIVSDNTWKVTADGPIRANNEYDGEEYDARKEMPGWDQSGFNDNQWLTVQYVNPQTLNAQLNKNIKVMDEVQPVHIKESKPGVYMLDMGQNMVGWLQIRAEGKSGDLIQLRFAEFLNKDGSVCLDNMRGGLVTDKYTMKGEGIETWEPHFTSHGFRFVEITGYPGTPSINDFVGKVIYDEMEQTGKFETSNKLINQIYTNSYWSIRGNYRGMPTDCPQRTERMGWLGDRAVGSYGESYIFDNNNLYAKWLHDISLTQREDGSISDIAPSYWSSYTDNMTWPGTYLMVADMLYERFGNKEPIEQHYESMKKWLNYMRDKYMTPEHIMPRDRYGDWCTPPEDPALNDPSDPTLITDGAVIGTSYYFHMLKLLEKFAYILDKPIEAKDFADQSFIIKDAYNKTFLDKEKGLYSNNTVTANLLSLGFGLVPEEYKEAVFKSMVDRTMGEFNGHLSTGVIGCQMLMRVFTDNGRPDIAFKIATNTTYPSWGYMIEKGATSIWEHWNGDALPAWIDSQNHVMLLGDLLIWCYEDLAGIQNSPNSNGFKQIKMHPYPIDGLSYVKASYKSVHGLIKSEWSYNNNTFIWDISVPCNSSATVYIPTSDKDKITESGKKASSAEGVKFIKMDGKYAVYEVGSGNYNFSSIL